jgi:hypothetical protein
MPEVRVSARGSEAVVHGCLAAGAELAWKQLTATLPTALGPDDGAAAPAQALDA